MRQDGKHSHAIVLRRVSTVNVDGVAEGAVTRSRIAVVAVPRRVHLSGEKVLVEFVVAVD